MTKDAPAFDLEAVLTAAATLANQHGVEVRVSRHGAISIKPVEADAEGNPINKRAERNRRYYETKRLERLNGLTRLKASESVLNGDSPSPSLSSPPAPPPAPSPTPPSPPAPTPAPPHPPTPAGAREAGDALALVIEAQPKPDRFDEFWKLYPRKVGKENARKKWETIKPEMVDTILAAVVAHTNSQDWCKEDGRFIPHPATWLHGHRWEDELKPALRSDVQAIETDNEELGFLSNDDAIFHKAK